ncbi:MAG TPA: hypothetical protein VLI94_05575 [Solirubrobacterales bacterium]|nr:hypothetical protein [Solirubrobacterales bacterium]
MSNPSESFGPSGRRDARIAEGLGWFSLGLGAAQLLAPGALNRLAGIRDDAAARLAQRFVGVREVGAFAAIMADRPRPVLPLWSRVGGDLLDLALLARAWDRKRESAPRLALTIANIAGVTGLDIYAAIRHTEAERRREPRAEGEGKAPGGGPVQVKAAVTIRKSREEVEPAWRTFEADGGLSGWRSDAAEAGKGDGDGVAHLRFVEAPAGQGTEVHAGLSYEPTAGKVGELLAKALGDDPAQKVKDDLRRFKQVVETGQVVRSEAKPDGTRTTTPLKERPAQPLPAGSRS